MSFRGQIYFSSGSIHHEVICAVRLRVHYSQETVPDFDIIFSFTRTEESVCQHCCGRNLTRLCTCSAHTMIPGRTLQISAAMDNLNIRSSLISSFCITSCKRKDYQVMKTEQKLNTKASTLITFNRCARLQAQGSYACL